MDFRTFVLGQAVSQDLLENREAELVFDFLALPETIAKMINFSDIRLPALSGIVETIEENFSTNKDFPLSNDTNRQVVGKMISFILNFFGYSPIKNVTTSEKRLRNFSNAKLFKTSAIYEKSHKPKLKLDINIIYTEKDSE